jgi:hypothetical protein
MRERRPVRGTGNWQYVDDELNLILRHIAVRQPYIGEPDGTKYVVTGDGHEHSTHDSLSDATAAAEGSLTS